MTDAFNAPRRANPPVKSTVFIDGSALFLAARAFADNRQLDYRALIDLLCEEIPGLAPPAGNNEFDPSHWVMWTSWQQENTGQSRFLEFAERELQWTVRRYSPSDSFLVDPAGALGLIGEQKVSQRLMRFDSAIAFAAGRVAESRRIVLVSDSFPLAEPLWRARALRQKVAPRCNNVLAFFSRALDPRWQRVIREREAHSVDFVDFERHDARLFGGAGREVHRPIDHLDY